MIIKYLIGHARQYKWIITRGTDRDFLLFTGTIQKTAESAEARRENNISLRLSASSAVNHFCHYSFIQNKLKSLHG